MKTIYRLFNSARRVKWHEFLLLSLVPAICAAMAILCYMLGGAHCRLLCDIVVVVSLPIFVASLMLVVYDARRLFRMGCRCKAVFGLAMYALAALTALIGLFFAVAGGPF